MPANTNFRSDFASLVKELQEKPDDPRLKKDLVSRLPEMKARAQHDPMALFSLAKIYPPTSPQFRTMMRQSAAKGCTNAMLSLSELLVKSGSQADLKTAAHYMQKILSSDDTYIKEGGKKLLKSSPALAEELRAQDKTVYNSKIRFFGQQEQRTEKAPAPIRATALGNW
jgi:hypothetical protein